MNADFGSIGARRVCDPFSASGILLDLGVSSRQIDDPERGFSFSRDGPLDMRMGGTDAGGRRTAEELLAACTEQELTRIIRDFGEQPGARRIAKAILGARPVTSTQQLSDVVGRCLPHKDRTKGTARVFQALRIAVNDEMGQLEAALAAARDLLRPGGRFVVLSYHSLEDRRVKRTFKFGDTAKRAHLKDLYGNVLSPWKPVGPRKPIVASEEELAVNSRARSVRMRVAERTDFGLEWRGEAWVEDRGADLANPFR